MVVERGYKQTDLGVLPENWQVVPISHAGLLINGRGFKPFEWSKSGLPIIRIQNLNGSDDFNYYSGSYDKKIEIHEAQLLFAWSGSRGTSFGPHIWNGPKGLLNYHTWKVVIKENIVNKDYFLHILRKLTKVIENEAHGASALVHVQKWQMEKFSFPLPPLPEQTAIANALSDMDALIAQTEKIIEKKKAIKQGVMQELLRPKEGWVTKKFTDIVEYIHGKAHEQFIVDSGKYKVVNSKFISTDGEIVKYSNISYLTAKKNDILTVLSDLPNGKALAKCFIVDQDNLYAVNQRICIWRSRGSNPLFLFYLLNRHKYFLQLDDGVTQTHILNGDINRFEIIITEDIHAQKEIGIILCDIDKEITNLENKRCKLKLQKQGMMQALLTGKIRLA